MQAWLVKPSRCSASEMAEMQEPYAYATSSFNEENAGLIFEEYPLVAVADIFVSLIFNI